MTDVIIKMKDGTIREFKHIGRAGGSYTKRVTIEGAFVVVTDEWDKITAIPAQEILEVTAESRR